MDFEPGLYDVSVFFEDLINCRSNIIVFNVIVLECEDSYLYVPNTFTPNSDSHNNYWKPICSNCKELKYIIYNRWGEAIFEGNDNMDGMEILMVQLVKKEYISIK